MSRFTVQAADRTNDSFKPVSSSEERASQLVLASIARILNQLRTCVDVKGDKMGERDSFISFLQGRLSSEGR